MASLFGGDPVADAKEVFSGLPDMPLEERIVAINAIRQELHKYSPFAQEPVDCVLWIPADEVTANDYNPNSVAPPEMKLLETSIQQDGYTQPIVAWKNGDGFEVVDGFHRHRVGKESKTVRKRVHGYLPLTIINDDRQDKGDRISATIRHNRARGKHKVEAMSDIVIELKRRNWSDDRIGRELGMEPDEVLRLCQISGLAEMFSDRDFSEAWEHTGEAEGPPSDEETVEADLEWMRGVEKAAKDPGWSDRTKSMSVLYGEEGRHLALIQRNRFKDAEWFVYIYTNPPQRHRVETLDEAKRLAEQVVKNA